MRTVETAALESADDKCVAARSERGIAVNVAAAPAAPRNLRREKNGIFMRTGKYSGNRSMPDHRFHSLKTSHSRLEKSLFSVAVSFACPTSRNCGEKWGTPFLEVT